MTRRRMMVLVFAGMLTMTCATWPVKGAHQAGEKERDARQTVEAFLAAALAGRVKEAAAMGEPGQAPSRENKVKELTDGLAAKEVKLAGVHVSEKGKRALVITESVQLARPNPDGSKKGRLAITLTKGDKRWLVRDIDFESEESAKEEVKRFLNKFPDAKPLPDQKGK